MGTPAKKNNLSDQVVARNKGRLLFIARQYDWRIVFRFAREDVSDVELIGYHREGTENYAYEEPGASGTHRWKRMPCAGYAAS